MNYRDLGKTGIRVSEIAFGGVEIGIPYGIGINQQTDMLPRNQAIVLLRDALEKGINFFDTARMYGESESIMGEAFASCRDKMVLATKCRHLKAADGKLPAKEASEHFIETSLRESLDALRTDYVDVFMLHQADKEILSDPYILELFLKLKKQGRIRAIGVSTYAADETRLAIENGWDLVQLPVNLADQRHAACFSLAAEKGTALVARSVLLKGLLSERGRNLHPALKQVEDHIDLYQRLIGNDIADLPSLATRFVLSYPGISSVLIGIDKTEYLLQALQTIRGGVLETPLFEKLKTMAYPEPDFLDLPAWNKRGWLR